MLDRPVAATLARSIAAQALARDPAGFSPEVRAKALSCLFDFLSCAFEARNLPWSRQALTIARPLSAGAGIVGFGVTTDPCSAAFVNGVLGHGLVREDMHAASIAHHGVVVWPTLLALAEIEDVDGARLIDAAVVGYEVGARLGRALFDKELARLFRPTGLTAPIGAAVAAARLLGLDEAQTTAAIGLAANMACGLNQWPHRGGSEMYFHPGMAARSAVTAVELARAGAYASEDILEGEAGLFAAFGRKTAPAAIDLFPNGEADILAVYSKPVPACNFAQTPCQVAAAMAGGGALDPARIREVAIRVSEAAVRYPGCDFAGPYERALQAKMSIQFSTAAALVRGGVAEANYSRLDDAAILRVIGLTSLEADAGFTAAFPAAQGGSVRVVLDDGSVLERSLPDVVPATAGQIRERAQDAAVEALGAVRAFGLMAAVDGIDGASSVRDLAAAFRTD